MIPVNFLQDDLILRLRDMIQSAFRQTVLDIHYKIRTEIPQIVTLRRRTMFSISLSILFAQMFSKVAVAGKKSSCYAADLSLSVFDDRQKVGFEIRW